MAGVSSGKRRLGEILDLDLAKRRQRSQRTSQSKFFSTSSAGAGAQKSGHLSERPAAGPSQLPELNKENVNIATDEDEDDDILATLSLKANVSPNQDIDFDLDEPMDGVIQEDGYMSPLSTHLPEAQEISSPGAVIFTPLKKKKRKSSLNTGIDARGRSGGPQDQDFDADPISSPISIVKKRRRQSCSPGAGRVPYIPLKAPTQSLSVGNDLIPAIPSFGSQDKIDSTGDIFNSGSSLPTIEHKTLYNGPDLQSHLGIDGSETESDEEASELPTSSRSKLGLVERRGKMKVTFQSYPPLMPGVSTRDLSGSKSKPGADREFGSDLKLDFISQMPQANQKTAFTGDALEPREAGINVDDGMEMGLDEDPEETVMKMKEERVKKVARGWRMRWALGQLKREDSSSSSSSATEQEALRSREKRGDGCKERRQSAPMALSTNRLRRDETNVTPLGKHSLAKTGTNLPFSDLRRQQFASSLPPKSQIKSRLSGSSSSMKETSNAESRQHPLVRKRSSLIFFDVSSERDTPTFTHRDAKLKFWGGNDRDIADEFSDEIVEISPRAWKALDRFR